MSIRLLGFRLFSLIAILVCMALIVDSLRPTPAFCGFRAGCIEVLHSKYSAPFGVPLPLVGMVAFTLFFLLSLYPTSWAGFLLGPLAIAVGMISLCLVGVQLFLLHRACPLCLVIDLSGMLIAALELGLPPCKDKTPPSRRQRWVWFGLVAVVLAAPSLWSAFRPSPEPPPQLKALWMEGRINVVEITDFACPYCRQNHLALKQLFAGHWEQIHFVRIVVPLEQHANSRAAAKLYLYACRVGKGEDLADALFTADDLSPQALSQMAATAELDTDNAHPWMSDPVIDRQLTDTARWVEAADHGGLPQVWVQGILLVGVQTVDSLQAAFQRARSSAIPPHNL